MKKLFVVFLIFTIGCENNNQKCDKVNPEQVKQVMVDFLHASNNSAFEELKNLTTSDFLVYVDGGEMNFNELVQFIKDWPEPDKFNFDEFDFEIETDCNSAFVNYHYGPTDPVGNGTQIELHSVYIKRDVGELKINFLHSNTME